MKLPILSVVVSAFLGAIPMNAKAGFYPDGTTSQAALDFGAPFAGRALSFKILVPGVGTGQRNTSASFFNELYAITSAHNVTDLLQYNPTYEVADGPNFLTDRGDVMTVVSVLLHPSLDLAILRFAAPFEAAPDQIIGSAATGDVTLSAGFGQFGTPSTGIVSPRDGGLKAWEARIQGTTIGGPDPFYQTTSFGNNSSGLTLNGRGANGDSGGPVFNSNWELIGINDSASLSDAPVGSTTFLRLGEASTRAWIEANTPVPEPSSTVLLALGILALASRRNQNGRNG